MDTLYTKSLRVRTTAWDGKAWNNGLPDSASDVQLNWPYDTAEVGGFRCRNLTVAQNGSLTINYGATVWVSGTKVVQESKAPITVNDGGNFALLNPAINTANISITLKRSIPNLQRLDYWFLGSPISGKTLLQFSPKTDTGRFYTYNVTGFAVLDPTKTYTIAGRGYMIRTPADAPATVSNWDVSVNNLDGVGTLNAGVIRLDLNKSPAVYVILSNPYASKLNLRRFFERNKKYLKKNVGVYYYTNGGGGNSYTYINNVCSNKSSFDVNVLPFQGFLIELFSVEDKNKIVFTPDMQLTEGNYTTPDRFYLNLFKEGVNLPYSGCVYDVENFEQQFYTYASSGYYIAFSENAVITKGSLISGMELPITIKTGTASNYTIKLDRTDGRFIDMAVYLVTTNGVVDLKATNYVFAGTASTTYNFKIRIV